MSIVTMTAESLGSQLGQVVPEMYVIIAKNSVSGLDASQIADLLGANIGEIQEIESDQTYKDVRLLIASEHAKTVVENDFSWDSIEHQALTNLGKRVHLEKDTDTLLRIAAVANKAQRRQKTNGNVLDAAAGGTRVPITLTSRLVKKLNAAGGIASVEETRQISVLDGSAVNPKFEDIDALLGVSRQPAVPRRMGVVTKSADELDSIEGLEFKG